MTKEFIREIVMLPAYDKRSADPKKNFGIHCAEMRWFLVGKSGIVQFVLYTGWYLPAEKQGQPMAADLGYHSPVPLHDFQGPKKTDEVWCTPMPCEYFKKYGLGDECYYDGSGLNAQPILVTLISKGSEAVWKELEKYYQSVFGGLK